VKTSLFDVLATVRYLILFYGSEDWLAKAQLLCFAPCPQLTNLTISHLYEPSASILEMLHSQLAVVGPKISSLSSFTFNFNRTTPQGLLDILACLPTVETLFLEGNVGVCTGSSPQDADERGCWNIKLRCSWKPIYASRVLARQMTLSVALIQVDQWSSNAAIPTTS
jgi:hypothetical protein